MQGLNFLHKPQAANPSGRFVLLKIPHKLLLSAKLPFSREAEVRFGLLALATNLPLMA